MRRSQLALAVVVALAAQPLIATQSGAAAPYLLPVPAGTEVLVFQGNSSAFSHTAGSKAQYAWDFTVGATQFPVVAARAGTVIGMRSDSTASCDNDSCWTEANFVLIDHGDDKTSALYLHLKTGSVVVKVGQAVAQGTLLGNADSTGYSEGTHLHFMVEATPTIRTAPGWWWSQSVPITFADAGRPLEWQSYTSRNAAQVAPTPTPSPTPVPPTLKVVQSCRKEATLSNPPVIWSSPFLKIRYTGDLGVRRGGALVFPAAGSGYPETSPRNGGIVAQWGAGIQVWNGKLTGNPLKTITPDAHSAYFEISERRPGSEAGKKYWVAFAPASPHDPTAVEITIRKCP